MTIWHLYYVHGNKGIEWKLKKKKEKTAEWGGVVHLITWKKKVKR
jgi:hypothetical protein